MGWNVINEENGAGTLQRTYVGHTMAHVDGSDPAYGTWNYYFHDHLGSTRRLRDASKTSVAAYEYMPYGQVYAASGTATATTHTYAMLAWDDTADLYFAPFRYYMPQAGRWTQRDPLGMIDGPNVYAYVGGAPMARRDTLGLCIGAPIGLPGPVDMVLNLSRLMGKVCTVHNNMRLIQFLLDALGVEWQVQLYWYKMVRPDECWDYKTRTPLPWFLIDRKDAEIFGNFNYGATGSQIWSQVTLYTGSMGAHGMSQGWKSPFTMGGEFADWPAIGNGIDFADTWKNNAKLRRWLDGICRPFFGVGLNT